MVSLRAVLSDGSICMNMRLRHVWGTIIQYEWWAFCVVIGVPPFIVLLSLYGIGVPQDFEVWQYAPLAVPTLAVIEFASQISTTNHLTMLFVRGITLIVSAPQYVFIVLYVLATTMTAAVTYTVARITAIDRLWAIVLALAFTLAPARFWFVDISMHWWLSIPLVWLVIYHWWTQPLHHWRIMYRYTVPLVVIPWLGWEHLVWSMMALVVAAVITAFIRPEWSWRQLAYAVIPVAFMTTLLHGFMPIAIDPISADGVRLLEFVVPHRTHWVPWLASLGERLSQLEIPRTTTVYGGILPLVGLTLVMVRAVRQLVTMDFGVAQPLFVWLFCLILLSGSSGWVHLWGWLGASVVSPHPVQLFIIFGALFTLVQWLQRQSKFASYAFVVVLVVVFVDQVPATNIMRHMRQTPRDIPTRQLTDGAWFGQHVLPREIVSVQGLSTIEPGYGRWSDADVADRIRIDVRRAFNAPVTIEIRARGVATNVGAPIAVRIGTEEQLMVLDTTVKPYLLTFRQPRGTVIEIIPQPVATPPLGDTRRIGIFLQSIRVVAP
jgi:hypothetical protein